LFSYLFIGESITVVRVGSFGLGIASQLNLSYKYYSIFSILAISLALPFYNEIFPPTLTSSSAFLFKGDNDFLIFSFDISLDSSFDGLSSFFFDFSFGFFNFLGS